MGLSIWAVLGCLAIQSADAPPPSGEDGFPCGKARAAAAWVAARGSESPGDHGAPRGGDGGIAVAAETDVLHYFLDIDANPTTQTIDGACTMTVKSLVAGLASFQFRLTNQLTITAVTVNGVSASWSRLDPIAVQVTLDPPVAANEEFTLFVDYQGTPPRLGFGSFTFGTQNGQPLIWTLSEPWYSYTWWPQKDDNRDKATGDIWITVPDTMLVASNGLLQGADDVAGGKKRFRWKTDYQMVPYLFSFSATNYHYYMQPYLYAGGSMPVELYIYPASDTAGNRNAWATCITMLAAFGDKYGLYPFISEKYGIAQFGFGGGMEHQTITGQTSFSEFLNSHELGHSWWGDNVTCATWADIWLNEGFATYSEAVWVENKPGSTGKPALLAYMQGRRPSSVNGSVYCYDDTNFGRVFSSAFSYAKGGWVQHMLRHIMGDDAFFEGLRYYRGLYEQDSAVTADYQAAMEHVHGGDLSWFFDEWVYDIGAPTYQYAWNQSTVAGRNFVELYVKQVQSAAYPVFAMPVDIVTSDGGPQSTHVLWNDAGEEHLIFETPAPITTLAFDPEKWILWEGATTTTFVEGPPKIVAVSPPPGSTADASVSFAVTFHEDVTTTAADYALHGPAGVAAFSFAYDAPTMTATLVPSAPLTPGAYRLTVRDTVIDAASGKSLDGEIAEPLSPAALPSGDGLPGGTASFRFMIGCAACDLNCDGSANQFDIQPFIDLLVNRIGCSPCAGDANFDGTVNQFDISGFLNCLGP